MINDILDALIDVVAGTGLRCTDLIDAPQAPCAMVYPDDIGGDTYFHSFKRGVADVPFVVEILYPSGNVRLHRELNDRIDTEGSDSVVVAVADNPTLGQGADVSAAGVRFTAHVTGVSEYGFATDPQNGIRYLRAKVNVNVKTTRGTL